MTLLFLPHGDTEQLVAAFWGDYNVPWGCSGGKELKSKGLNDLENSKSLTLLPVGWFDLESVQQPGLGHDSAGSQSKAAPEPRGDIRVWLWEHLGGLQ